MRGFVFGVVFTILVAASVLYVYFATGMAPVATSASPMPFEKKLARMALHARLEREMPIQVPVPADETNLVAGAHVYMTQCAVCHGVPGREQTAIAEGEFPRPPHLFIGKGVTDDEPGETYWKGFGRYSAYRHAGIQSNAFGGGDGQVSLLLAHAAKLPDPAKAILQETNKSAR